MTCREKFMKDHPGCSNYLNNCPSTYGYLDDPEECAGGYCERCWNREIPEQWPKDNPHISEGIKEATEVFRNIATGAKFAGAACENLAKGAKKVLESVKQPTINHVVDEVHMQCGNFQIIKHPDGSSTLIKTGEDTPDEPKIVSLQEHHEQVTEFHRIVGEALESKGSIKDSGDRTEFATGAVRDMREGKGRCDLMPLEVISRCINYDTGDTILDMIRMFQIENNTRYLYEALEVFSIIYFGGSNRTMFLEVAKHFEEGAKKYGPDNWRKGIPTYCYIDSAVRHYLKLQRGDKDEPHDRAFVWNLMCCIWEVDYHKEDIHEEN